jgi:hypothetical protein
MWVKDGFLKNSVDTNAAMQQLKIHIESFTGKLKQFSSEELLKRPAPDKWSKQEILGHLIDSAINNLKRFTEIQFLPQPYTVISYQQNELVIVNGYQDVPLQQLLDLWQSLNRQIIYVVKVIPADKLNYPVDPQYESGEMKTLAWIICDYVAHLEHHLRQITGNQS